jgi:hypothetical protein
MSGLEPTEHKESKRCCRDVPPWHQTPDCPDNINNNIKIDANTNMEIPPGVAYYYTIWAAGVMPVRIEFCHRVGDTGVSAGITNEALIACMIDRLEHFQITEFACPENADALVHLKQAMKCLHARTRRRHTTGVKPYAPETMKVIGGLPMEGMYADEKHAEAEKSLPRVKKDDTHLGIAVKPGSEVVLIKLEKLKEWGQWAQVESAVKRMVRESGPLNETEMDVIRSCAVNDSGKRGLAEFEQAYAQTR